MVLYCSAHETAVLRMLVHKMINHPEEEMVFVTTVGTYPFHDSKRDLSFLYKSVIEFNTALGKTFEDKEQIRETIIKEIDRLLELNSVDLNQCSEIYVTEDIFHPYTIYFESKNISYTAIEISPHSFENKSKFNIENNLYRRSVEYFELSQELGAFIANGKNCKKRIIDKESLNGSENTTGELVYDYVESISSLSQEDLNKCVDLYVNPENIKKDTPFNMVLTNSRGFIEGNCPGITCDDIPRIYQKLFDYYLCDKDNIILKPHPNSQGINYLKLFEKGQIFDEKFLVDLIPFIENVQLDTVINVASTASILLEKYCNESISLGTPFFKFSSYILKLYGLFYFMKENAIDISKIYTIDINKEQLELFLKYCFANSKVQVEIWNEDVTLSTNSLILVDRFDLVDSEAQSKILNIKDTHSCVAILADRENPHLLKNRGLENSTYLLEITEWINRLDVNERTNLLFISDEITIQSICHEKTLKFSHNYIMVKSARFCFDARICVFGGNIVRWITESLKKKFAVTYLPWISPLSISSKGVDDIENLKGPENVSDRIELKKDISKWMSDTDYFIFDLETLRYDLLECNDTYFTDTRSFRNSDFFKQNEGEIKSLNVLESDEKFIEGKLNDYVDLLLSMYEPKNIILIRHGRALNSYISNHIIKNWRIEKYNEFIAKWEEYIIKNTNCKTIDIWEFYMSKYGDNALFFEKQFYDAVTWNVIAMIGNINLLTINDADFSYRLRGYLKFYDFAVFRKYVCFFMVLTDDLECFISKTSKKFIEENFDTLVEIKRKKTLHSDDILANYDYSLNAEIKQAYDEINAIENSYYLDNSINFSSVFDYKFEILKTLEVKLKDYITDIFDSTIDVNSQNIYEIFLLVKQYHNKMLSKNNCLSLLQSINTLTERKLIDVWGSCVSREIFNMDFSYFKVNAYLMRNSIIHTGLQPVTREDGLLISDNFTNEWVFRNCSSEWNRTSEERLYASDSQWIVIDMHDVFYPNYYYKNEKNVFCKSYNLDFMPFYNFIKEDIHMFDYSDEKFDDMYFLNLLQHSIEILRKKYENRIIVIDTIWKKYYLDEHRNIKEFPMSDEESKANDRKNHIAHILSNYLVDKLNCYHITFLKEFLADELWHGGEISRSHYERYFYEEAYCVIEDIVKRQPEKREYSHSRLSTRIRRIRELSSHKNNREYLLSVYNTYLDEILIELDNSIIDKFEIIIETIYLKNYQDAEQMLSSFNFKDNKALELYEAMYKVYKYL